MLEALGIDLKEIIFAMVNFLILVGVLGKFIYKPLIVFNISFNVIYLGILL